MAMGIVSDSETSINSNLENLPNYQMICNTTRETPITTLYSWWKIFYLCVPDVNTLVERAAGQMAAVRAKGDTVHWLLVFG